LGLTEPEEVPEEGAGASRQALTSQSSDQQLQPAPVVSLLLLAELISPGEEVATALEPEEEEALPTVAAEVVRACSPANRRWKAK
jgi:hypothetical protein